MGNLQSVLKAFRRLNIPAKMSFATDNIEQASGLVILKIFFEVVHAKVNGVTA